MLQIPNILTFGSNLNVVLHPIHQFGLGHVITRLGAQQQLLEFQFVRIFKFTAIHEEI